MYDLWYLVQLFCVEMKANECKFRTNVGLIVVSHARQSWVMCHVSLSCIMCHVSCVMCHVSCVMCNVPCVMCHVSCAMCHVSRVTCHVSCDMWPVTCDVNCWTLEFVFCFLDRSEVILRFKMTSFWTQNDSILESKWLHFGVQKCRRFETQNGTPSRSLRRGHQPICQTLIQPPGPP